jgi:Tat protein secretion system quality control protein TatD with DNase activity
VIHTANRIAELRQMRLEEVAYITSENTKRIFRL